MRARDRRDRWQQPLASNIDEGVDALEWLGASSACRTQQYPSARNQFAHQLLHAIQLLQPPLLYQVTENISQER